MLSTLLFSTAPTMTGCDGGGGGGTGGEGGSSACEAPTHMVHACLQIDETAPATGPFDVETTGVVTAVRTPQAGDPINGQQYCAGSHDAAPDVMIDLEETDGSKITVSFAAPGFSQSSVAQGQTLGVRFHREQVEGTAASTSKKMLEIKRDGALVAAVGTNMPAGPTPQGGADICLQEFADDCPRMHQAMDFTAADGTTVSVAEGASADVDGLLVTNDEYFRYYDNGCNFALSAEYAMSAVAQ